MIAGEHQIQDLRKFIVNGTRGNKLAVFDFDGTIYKGYKSEQFGSFSNADMLYFLFPSPLKYPKKFIQLLPLYWQLFFMFLDGRRKFISGSIDRSKFEQNMIEFFHFRLAKKFSLTEMEVAAKKCTLYIYPDVIDLISYLNKKGFKLLIVSKANDLIINAFKTEINDNYDIELETIANPILLESQPDIELIVSSNHKFSKMCDYLSRNTNFSRLLIFGDTEEDLGLYLAAIKLKLSIFLISIGEKSNKLIKSADLIVNNYEELNSILINNEGNQ